MVLFALIALWVALITLGVLVVFFWMRMLTDIIQRQFPNSSDKLVWLVVVAFTFGFGALLYYMAVKKAPQQA